MARCRPRSEHSRLTSGFQLFSLCGRWNIALSGFKLARGIFGTLSAETRVRTKKERCMHSYDVATWRTFFLAMIGAAATLTGLLFVSVSINLDRILSGGRFLPARARESLASLVLIVAYSSLTLVPQSTTALGIEVLVMAAPLLAATLWDQIDHLRSNPSDPILWAVSRMVATGAGTVPATL